MLAISTPIEDMRYKMKRRTLSFYTMEELDDKLAGYAVSRKNVFDSDISDCIKHGAEIEQLFQKPDSYKDGHEFKAKIQRLIEENYLKAISEKKTDLQDSLVYLFYEVYKTTDSLVFQEGIIFGLEKYGAKTIDQAKHDMLAYFCLFNAEAFEKGYDEAHFIHRISNQRRILRFFLSHNDSQILKQLGEYLKGDIQSQTLKNIYLETLNEVPEDYLDFGEPVLSVKQKRLLSIALKNDMTKRYFIQDIYDMGLPKQIGYMYIKDSVNEEYLNKLILDEKLSAEYRLYALLRLVSNESNPFSVLGMLEGLISRLPGANDGDKAMIAKETEEILRSEAEEILHYEFRKLSSGDNYLDSLEAEMLFAAAAVLLHETYQNIDLGGFLKQLKFSFVKDNTTEFIVKYSGSDESEHVRIAMPNNKEYISAIKDFVESIYRRNGNDKAGETGKNGWQSIAKGPSALIKVVRKMPHVDV